MLLCYDYYVGITYFVKSNKIWIWVFGLKWNSLPILTTGGSAVTSTMRSSPVSPRAAPQLPDRMVHGATRPLTAPESASHRISAAISKRFRWKTKQIPYLLLAGL